jgi:hypothetical protein
VYAYHVLESLSLRSRLSRTKLQDQYATETDNTMQAYTCSVVDDEGHRGVHDGVSRSAACALAAMMTVLSFV